MKSEIEVLNEKNNQNDEFVRNLRENLSLTQNQLDASREQSQHIANFMEMNVTFKIANK